MVGSPLGNVARTTSHKVVIPFYLYAAVSFLAGTVLLFLSHGAFTGHYFQPHILAITHTMALGWGTMIILGASHQLFPVLIEADLYSEKLAYASFLLAGLGIPVLVQAFFRFSMGAAAQLGGSLVVAGVLCYLANIFISISKSKRENVHAVFVFTAALWLLLTVALGLTLVIDFTGTDHLLPRGSLHYLSLHAHLGIVGWFLLLVLGVGSRLIPMFLISKHSDPRMLWAIYALVNAALLGYAVLFLYFPKAGLNFIPALMVLAALLLFAGYCRKAYMVRIRRKVDHQMKVSLLSVGLLVLPTLVLLVLIAILVLTGRERTEVTLLYGFTIFFGWITAIILGMTFKTLPFIVWNKVYRPRAYIGKMPSPKDLYCDRVFVAMAFTYLAGFAGFAVGILAENMLLLQSGAALLLLAAILYNWNIGRMVFTKKFKP